MDGLIVLGILLILALLAGAVLGFINLGQISTLKRQVAQLSHALYQQGRQLEILKSELQNKQVRSNSPPNASIENRAQSMAKKDDAPIAIDEGNIPTPEVDNKPTQQASSAETPPNTKTVEDGVKTRARPEAKRPSFSLEAFLSGNSLLWLGGAVLALGGVFLAKYSIEAGLFPPQLRILLGAGFGLTLIVAADYLYRHPKRFQMNTPVVSAALASGGLITCFAMTLVAFDFYDYLSPTFAFALLAIISIAGAWLSLRLGPILAAIGIIGAYAVPALVSTGSNNVLMLLLYVAAVSFSSVWIHQVVKRQWLWWLSLFGHFAWYSIAIFISIDQSYQSPYANAGALTGFGLLSLYLFSLFPILGWDLRIGNHTALGLKEMLMPRKEHLGVLLSLAGIALYSLSLGFQDTLILMLLAYCAALMLVPLRHSAFDTWPFLALISTLFVFVMMPVDYDYTDNLFVFGGAYLFIQAAVLIAMVYAFFMQSAFPQRPAFLLLLVLIPLSLFGIAYALSKPAAAQYLYPLFAAEIGFIALLFAWLGARAQIGMQKLSYLLLANGALALIFTMMLSASTLTLALAAQVAMMAALSTKYKLTLPNWLYKIAILAISARLTASPWLPEYAGEFLLGLHWTLVVYPAVFALLFFARSKLSEGDLKLWFDGAMLHLIALFITTESSYFLVGEYPDLANLGFKQSALLGMNYIILAGVYLWRAKLLQAHSSKPGHSKHASLYYVFSTLLFLAAIYMHMNASLLGNPFIELQDIGTNPVVNWLVPLWLIPALSLFAMAHLRLVHQDFILPLRIASAVLGVLYINGFIRLCFTDNIALGYSSIGQAELYTYSVVYLGISIACILFAKSRRSPTLNRLGFGILAVVVLKAFVIDMANLEGLYRALSFIGLGLSLIGIAWLFQRFVQKGKIPDNQSNIIDTSLE